MVNAHSLLQVNTVPSNKHSNILDLVVTNSDNLITGPNEYSAEFDTDHSILKFILNIDTTVNRDISRTAYNFKRINSTFLANLNNDTNLCDNVNNACNIDDAWAKWNSLVMDIINKCVPKITIKDKSIPPWLDGEVRHLRNQKHAAWSAAKRYDRHSSWRKFKYLRIKLCKMLKNKRHRFMESMAESIKNNPKRFWAFCRKKIKSKLTPSVLKYLDKVSTTSSQKSAMFSSYFHFVFSDTNDDMSLPVLTEQLITSQLLSSLNMM